jgi:hypothetical protein
MSVKGVVEVHSCYNIELGEPRPVPCACRKIVSIVVANQLVKLGAADWETGYDRRKPYPDGGKICLTGRTSKTPRCATIEKAHIERAYVDNDLEEKTRIEDYGALTKAVRMEITKKIPEKDFLEGCQMEWGFLEGYNCDWGIPVLQFTENNRTFGGINREER